MPDIGSQIRLSGEKLEQLHAYVSSSPTSSLPPSCFETWTKRSSIHSVLSRTAQLVDVRKAAWDVILALNNATASKTENGVDFILFNGVEVEFAVARHLAMASYVATSWSIYDRLANTCGRLAAVNDIAENPRHNPKACEDFLRTEKGIFGFSAHQYISQSYQWPMRVSYKIRNWLVHEGYEFGDIPLFAGERIGDGFQLHPNAVDCLQDACGYKRDGNGVISYCCINETDEPWSRQNLLEIISAYDSEIDTMFTAFVSWSVEVLDLQVRAFLSRDR